MDTTDGHGGDSAVMENDPLTPHEVAAFLEGRLEGEELARVEAYLADNPAARQELIKASRILRTVPEKKAVKRSRRFYPLIGFAAAAAIGIVLIRPGDVKQTAPVSTERRGIGDQPEQILLVSPVDAGEIGDRTLPLTWHAVDGATYRIFISDASGNSIVRTSTSDTSLVLPESVQSGATYYWRVDAIAPDGSSLTSGYHEFKLIGR